MIKSFLVWWSQTHPLIVQSRNYPVYQTKAAKIAIIITYSFTGERNLESFNSFLCLLSKVCDVLSGKILTVRQRGEICIRGPTVMKGESWWLTPLFSNRFTSIHVWFIVSFLFQHNFFSAFAPRAQSAHKCPSRELMQFCIIKFLSITVKRKKQLRFRFDWEMKGWTEWNKFTLIWKSIPGTSFKRKLVNT